MQYTYQKIAWVQKMIWAVLDWATNVAHYMSMNMINSSGGISGGTSILRVWGIQFYLIMSITKRTRKCFGSKGQLG